MSIKIKLVACALAMGGVTAAVGAAGLGSIERLERAAFGMYDGAVGPVLALRRAQSALNDFRARHLSGPLEPGESFGGGDGDGERAGEVARSMRVAFDEIGPYIDALPSDRLKSDFREIRRLTAELASADGDVSNRFLSERVDVIVALIEGCARDIEGRSSEIRAALSGTSEQVARDALYANLAALAASLVTVLLLWRAVVPFIERGVKNARALAAADLTDPGSIPAVEGAGELSAALALLQSSVLDQFKGQEKQRLEEAAGLARLMATQKEWVDIALNTMQQGVLVLDKNHHIRVANERFVRLFSTADEQVQRYEDGTPMLENLRRDLLKATTGGSYTVRRPGNRVVEIHRKPIPGPNGGLLITAEDISERHVAEAKLERLARHDALTDLANRVEFRDRLEGTLATRPVAVLFLDLDRFKDVNDTLGHPVGDQLLREVAQRLLAASGPGDVVARLGGDEFAIIQTSVPGNGAGAAERLARAVIDAVAKPFEIDRHELSVGVSVGIVAGDRHADADELIKNGDLALYAAKEGGRNTHRVYVEEMSRRIERRRALEADLRVALVNNELELFYQPFFDVGRDAISGFEALIRWRHPERGMVSPGEFIPIAEEFGMIEDIGDWALRTACKEAMTWPKHLTVSVNLSPLQFKRKTLIDDTRAALSESGLPASRLWLEVTESLMLHDVATILRTLKAFKGMGIRIAMDDFGTGYSSLAHLSKYPFDKVKIDQSFTRNMDDAGNMGIIRAVIGLSRSMNLDVIAEGVETAEQRDALRKEGCVEMQGYFFGKPMPTSDLPALLMGQARRNAAAIAASSALRVVA